MSPREDFDPARTHIRALARVMQIHDEIRTGRCPNARTLAARLERSERTIKRDMRVLREDFRAPLFYDHAKRGWRYREPGWTFPLQPFKEGEMLAFFTAAEILRATGHAPEAMLFRAALAKLADFLPPEVSVNLATLGEALTYESLPHVVVDPRTLDTLARAAATRRRVSFDYYSQHRAEQTHRAADVLLLRNFGGDWYAIAYDHLRRDVRDFHVGRISHLTLTGEYFDPPDGWNANEYLRRGFQMTRGGRLTTVEIIFDAYQARWMRERETFHPEERREDLPDGSMRLTFPVGRNGLEAVARFCTAYAGHCRAVRPRALRQLIRERLLRALQDHE